MELRPVAKLCLGGALLITSQTLSLFSLFRGVDWLQKNAPAAFAFISNQTAQTTLLWAGFGMCAWGLYEVWKGRGAPPSRGEEGKPRPPDTRSPPSTTHGDRSHNFSGNIGSVTINESPKQTTDEPSSGKLSLCFDPNDAPCRQHEEPLIIPHHLFRVRVNNDSPHTAHKARVLIETAPTDLAKFQGVELQVRHNLGVSVKDIGAHGKEYFDFLDYNSYDIAVNQPVLHICHVAASLGRRVLDADYEFGLKAFSEERSSDEIRVRFRRKSPTDYQVEQIAPTAPSEGALPEHRPKIAPARYGPAPNECRPVAWEGLYVDNHGEPAFDLEVQPLSIMGWVVEFGHVDKLNDKGFLGISISKGINGTTRLGDIWHESPEAMLKALPLSLYITYRDFEGIRYRTICELYRDVRADGGFSVSFVRQELLKDSSASLRSTSAPIAPEVVLLAPISKHFYRWVPKEYVALYQGTWPKKSLIDYPLFGLRNLSSGLVTAISIEWVIQEERLDRLFIVIPMVNRKMRSLTFRCR
jgi:hypothetical protein